MKQRIDRVVGFVLVILMAVMTIDVLWGVFTRYVMGNQASWSEELARFLLIWIGILGAGYAAGQKAHLAIDLLAPNLNEKGQQQLKIGIDLIVAVFALLVMVIGGGRLIYISQTLGQLSPALQIPMWIVYSVVPLGGLLVVFYKLEDLLVAK